jgi:Skp family chaperone for outer membrane proteins
VKQSLLLAAAVAIVLVLDATAGTVAAQQFGSPMAIIDTNHIYQNHVRYQTLITDVKRDMMALQNQAENERKSLIEMTNKLKDYKKNSPDYKTLEEEITRKQAALQAKFSLEEKNILERRAKILYDVHQEMAYYVKDYAERNGIKLVIRFTGDLVQNTNDPDEISRELNKLVMHYSPSIDITKVILDACNRTAAPQATRPATNPITLPR